MFAGNPIENLRRCDRFLRRMGIQGPSNSAPAVLDYLLGKLLRLGCRLEFAGCTNGPALLIVALGRYVSTIGNVPSIVIRHVLNFQQTLRAAASGMSRIWRSATSSSSPGLRGKVRLLQATCRSGRTRTAPESSVPDKLVHAR